MPDVSLDRLKRDKERRAAAAGSAVAQTSEAICTNFGCLSYLLLFTISLNIHMHGMNEIMHK